MRKMSTDTKVEKLSVGLDGLADMLSVGRNTAQEIGKAAGASFKIGRRRLYDVGKVRKYLANITDDNSEV